MPVNKDPSGRRWVQVEAEVPGTPETVWKAIATGPGISSWFVPSQVEEREGGTAISNFGPGMDSTAKITVWDPPRRFVDEGEGGMGPNSPPMATEWTVEARSGGTCVVRVVHSLFADGDDWDNQLIGVESGWPAFFRILRIYLAHFPGQPSAAIALLGMSTKPPREAWPELTDALGLTGAKLGQKVRGAAGAARFAGVVEGVGVEGHPEFLVRLEEPSPGTMHLFAPDMGGQTMVSLRVYLYGEKAAATVAREDPQWQAWLAERFPMGEGVVPHCEGEAGGASSA